MISSMLTDLSWMNQQESNECVKKELYDAGIQIAWTATANDQISKCLKYIVEDIGIETIFGRWKIWDWKLFLRYVLRNYRWIPYRYFWSIKNFFTCSWWFNTNASKSRLNLLLPDFIKHLIILFKLFSSSVHFTLEII